MRNKESSSATKSPAFFEYGQVLVGGAGLFILWLRWREARRLQMEAQGLDLQA